MNALNIFRGQQAPTKSTDELIFDSITTKWQVHLDVALRGWFNWAIKAPAKLMRREDVVLLNTLKAAKLENNFKAFDLDLVTDIELFIWALRGIAKRSGNSREIMCPAAMLGDLFIAVEREVAA